MFGWVVAVIVLWLGTVLLIAFRCRRMAAWNPLEWLPFFLIVPFIGLIVLVVGVVLGLLAIPAVIVATILSPFVEVPEASPHGILFRRRIGSQTRMIRWREIRKFTIIEQYADVECVVTLDHNEEVDVTGIDPDAAIPYLKDFGVAVVEVPL